MLPAPLLEALPATYRLIDQVDTLKSYWAPDSALTDTLFHFTEAHGSRVLVRAQFVPATAMRRAGLDTLTFRPTQSELFYIDRTGYSWYFGLHYRESEQIPADSSGVPLRLLSHISSRLMLTDYRRWPQNGAVYQRNDYLVDYPFQPVAVAKISDSLVYVWAFPVRPHVPRPDTLVTYYRSGRRTRRVPYAADQLDTTRLAVVRLSFRQLKHSANEDQ